MVKKFKQALLYTIYLGILIGTSLVMCWILGALVAVGTKGFNFTLGYF